MNTTPRPNKTRKITLAATAALLATMSLASCTTPGSTGQSTTTIPSSVPAGTDGTLTPTKAKTGFAVSDNKTEVIMAISAISATLTPTGDTSWDLTLKGVDDTMARTGPADSARVQTTTFFDDPSNLTVRLGTANSVLSGDVAGTGASDLILAVSTPTLNKDNTATLQASSVPTGEIGRALARSGGITITAEGQTTKEINTLPTASTDTITVNNATLYISAGGTEVIDDCAIVPDANCENADLFQSNLVGANLQGANLQGANLAMSTLRNANFDDANLDTAQLFRSDLTNSTFIDATLDEATLEQSTLIDANLTGVSAKRVNLFRSELRGINLNDSNFTDSNLAQTIAQGARIKNADFSHTDLTGADLRNSDLTGTDLSYANLAGANLTGANLTDTNLTGTILWLADINGTTTTRTIFANTTCPNGTQTQQTNTGTPKRPNITQTCTPIYFPATTTIQTAGPRTPTKTTN